MTVSYENRLDESPKPVAVEQADGYVADAEEATELVDELVSTTTLYDLFGQFITATDSQFNALEKVSIEHGNAVLTHVNIVDLHTNLVSSLHSLRDELIEKLAQRGEQITEKGGTLRTQVLNDEAEED